MNQPLPKDVTAATGDRRHAGAHIERPDELGREQYSISDLTSEFGCTARALRFYEDEGLIAPSRIGLTRIYSKRDRARLAWIMRAKNVGFSLVEIREMIADVRIQMTDHHDQSADAVEHERIDEALEKGSTIEFCKTLGRFARQRREAAPGSGRQQQRGRHRRG